jgi:hypothetical protein
VRACGDLDASAIAGGWRQDAASSFIDQKQSRYHRLFSHSRGGVKEIKMFAESIAVVEAGKANHQVA